MHSMEDLPSRSNYTDKEDCISESKSNLSLSVGCFPYKDTIACEDTTTCEDSTSEGSSTHCLPPVQGTEKTERIRHPMGRQDEVRDNPKKFCNQTITLVLDADMGSDHEDSLANWDLSGENPRMNRPVWGQGHILDNPEKLCKLTITLIMDTHTGSDHEDPLADRDLNRDNQRVDECPQENTELTLRKLEDVMQMLKAVVENQKDDKHFDTVLFRSPQEEDLHLSSSVLYQVSDQKHEACQALPKCKPPENEDINQFLEMPRRLEEDELVEVSMELLDFRARDRLSGGAELDSIESVTLPAVKQRWTLLHEEMNNGRTRERTELWRSGRENAKEHRQDEGNKDK